MADGAPVSRRDFVKAAVIAASAAALGVGAVSSLLPGFSGGPEPRPMPILRGSDARTSSGPLTLRDLDGPAVATAAGTWSYRPALVLKLRKGTLEAAAGRRGYNTGQYALQHPDEPDHVVLAYDAKCTHLGCTVAFNHQLGASLDVPTYDNGGEADGRIMCPCHQSQFDAYDLANNLPNMPARRPLPVLEIRYGPEVDGLPSLEAIRRIDQPRARAADKDSGSGFHLAG